MRHESNEENGKVQPQGQN